MINPEIIGFSNLLRMSKQVNKPTSGKNHFVQGCSSKTRILQSNVNKYQASTKALIYSFTNENIFSVNAVF